MVQRPGAGEGLRACGGSCKHHGLQASSWSRTSKCEWNGLLRRCARSPIHRVRHCCKLVHAAWNRLIAPLLLAKLAEAVTRRFVAPTLDRLYRLPCQAISMSDWHLRRMVLEPQAVHTACTLKVAWHVSELQQFVEGRHR